MPVFTLSVMYLDVFMQISRNCHKNGEKEIITETLKQQKIRKIKKIQNGGFKQSVEKEDKKSKAK